jgi:hypothetical protein
MKILPFNAMSRGTQSAVFKGRSERSERGYFLN